MRQINMGTAEADEASNTDRQRDGQAESVRQTDRYKRSLRRRDRQMQ